MDLAAFPRTESMPEQGEGGWAGGVCMEEREGLSSWGSLAAVS